MELILRREDLETENKAMPCSQMVFDSFNNDARHAIFTIGRACFRERDETNCKMIYPPSEEGWGKGK